MRKLHRFTALALSVVMTAGMLTACGAKNDDKDKDKASGSKNEKGSVYFLNFKPEIAKVYEKVAKEYEKEKNVKVKVVTAASGTYEQTLKSEVAKSDAPTIFQINGPVGYASWKDYCVDLKDTKLYADLTDKNMAIRGEDGGVYGIPYAVEGYGIIYNDEIMQKYFKLNKRATDIKSTDEIKDFATLKSVVEDMTKHKKELGIDGVFASTSMSEGNQWRWQTHLANVPFYYEFSENKDYDDPATAGANTDELKFSHEKNFKNIFDLYVDNSVSDRKLLSSKSVDDSMAEFALGKAAMVQNGNWAWSQISDIKGNVVKKDNIKFMPIYTGTDKDEEQGLCIGTENFLAVNKKASDADQKASIDFLEWLYTSETGKKFVTKDLGFIAPFSTFNEDEKPDDPLAKQVIAWMERKDVKTIPWAFTTFPSERFKNDFGSSLLEYVQGTGKWDDVTKTVRDSWKSEKTK